MRNERGNFAMTDPYSAPMHGDRGEDAPEVPAASMAIAISREAGARGESIARRVASRLGWEVYSREHLEFLGATDAARQPILADLSTEGRRWVTVQLERLRQAHGIDPDAEGQTAQLILTLAAKGQAVFVGRAAGFFLPRSSSLHVRIVAPLADRVAHMADLFRMTAEEASAAVRQRDERRAEFLSSRFGHRPGDTSPFDLVLNSGLLSEETCTDVILAAFNGKQEVMEPESRIE